MFLIAQRHAIIRISDYVCAWIIVIQWFLRNFIWFASNINNQYNTKMKTKILTLALAFLTIGLLGSCEKEDPKVSVGWQCIQVWDKSVRCSDQLECISREPFRLVQYRFRSMWGIIQWIRHHSGRRILHQRDNRKPKYAGSVLSGTVKSLPECVVFLPAAGSRKGSNISNNGNHSNCWYWSSSALDNEFAYRMIVDMGYVYHAGGLRYLGFSVRLVTDVK